jgi:hypothetical protein
VNPSHLVAGTQADNVKDMHEKQRGRKAKGEAHGRSKLTDEKVNAIRADLRTDREIAKSYGVSKGLVWQVKARTIWAHI